MRTRDRDHVVERLTNEVCLTKCWAQIRPFLDKDFRSFSPLLELSVNFPEIPVIHEYRTPLHSTRAPWELVRGATTS